MGQTDVDPQTTEAGGYVGLLADSEAGNVTNLQGQGNQPPYSNPAFAQNIWVKVATLVNNSTGSQRLSTGFFEAPCGFVWVKAPSATFPDGFMSCEIKSGKYKGVHALSMGS